MNKNAGMTDLFLFIIIAFAIVFISGIFIYIGNTASDQLHETLDGEVIGSQNTSETIDDTFGAVPRAFNALYWISIFLILGMVISIFIGSYLVTTKPIFFIPYLFVIVIAIIVAVGVSQGYEMGISDPTISETFEGFVGSNFIMLNLPIWIAIIGFVGAIIMFVRMGSRDDQIYGYGGNPYG